MQITIDIPEEFVSEYKDDKFGNSLQRLKSDAHLLAGNYEKEVVDMLIKAFKNATEESTPNLPTPPHPSWKPKESEFYYYIGDTGGVHIDKWNSDDIDEFRFITGNVFQTSTEAEFVVEHLKVLAAIQEWAGYNYDGAYIYYHRPSDEILVNWNGDSTYCFGDIRFKCVDDAENCIKAVGKERLKKYYFLIP
jgi:hypothetical protein